MLRKTCLDRGWRFAAQSWLPLPKRVGFSQHEWLPADVPGHVHLDLLRAEVIADPLVLRHELGAQWIDEEDWCYETEFEFQPDAQRPRRVLCFGGLDTIATVLLNGRRIAEHDDMFVPIEVDVSDELVPGPNTLRVEFASALRVGRARRTAYFSAEHLPPDVERFDERAFVRKAQYMYGWDWGPRLLSAGIWQPVELLEFRARIEDVHVTQVHEPGGAVRLTVRSRVDGEGAAVRHRLTLGAYSAPLADGEALRIEAPELWWPLGMGDPALYTLESELVHEGEVLDRRTQRIGLRTVELVQEPDAHGTSFGFVVNGRPLWALGANWIPDHSFPSQVDRARVRAAVERARALGMNMLRIWGGGLYESDDFYDVCDECGILVWQDFPFACNYAPDDEPARAAVRAEASLAIVRLRNRASLALWCGNNENRTMYETRWGQKDKHPPRYYGERIWEGTLPELLAELDPGRPYLSSSPMGGPSANADEAGDQHYWDVWHGRGDWQHYRDSRGRFLSEFGFASAPGRAAWRRALGAHDPDALDPRHPIARWHDKTGKGYDTFIGYVERHYPSARTLAEWSYFSQCNQRDAMRFALEHHRAGTFCRGALIWQLNDCWPVQSWALIDSEGECKAAAHEIRRLFAPALACVFLEAGRLRVVVALDNVAGSRRIQLAVELTRTTDGHPLLAEQRELELEPGQRQEALLLDLSGFEPREGLLTVTLDGVSSARLLCEPKDARLERAPLSARFVDGAIEVACGAPVIDLFLESTDSDCRFLDNYKSLAAAGTLRFPCSGRPGALLARSLAGVHEVALAPASR